MRDLRHRLRDYLRRVEAGEAFEVTSFGRTVAHLGPVPT
ncbi:MAG: type II toxin-antitoxin system prevent-host-death family antitoxin [Chloroflexi bacterium]|nr:type II toxin-antitoxin system prevent-host-death family antitoxin [Chloroflexota bacterium]